MLLITCWHGDVTCTASDGGNDQTVRPCGVGVCGATGVFALGFGGGRSHPRAVAADRPVGAAAPGARETPRPPIKSQYRGDYRRGKYRRRKNLSPD